LNAIHGFEGLIICLPVAVHIGSYQPAREVAASLSVYPDKLFTAKPSSIKTVPKLNRVQLYRELVDAPHPLTFNALACPVKGDAVHLADGGHVFRPSNRNSAGADPNKSSSRRMQAPKR
jgi:hypothetical protein